MLLLAGVLALSGACTPISGAKVSGAEAEKIALARVPNGTIKEAELETEHGRIVWRFDIITQIHVDAITGEIVVTEKEDKK